MSGPRNRAAYERGQALRAEIREILQQRSPLARPLTAREILGLLSRPASERTVQWHMSAIRLDAESDALRSAQFIR